MMQKVEISIASENPVVNTFQHVQHNKYNLSYFVSKDENVTIQLKLLLRVSHNAGID